MQFMMIESTEFMGCFCPFNLEELELKLCKIMDYHENVDDSRLDDDRKKVTQSIPSLQQPLQPNQQGSSNNSDLNSRLRNIDDLTDKGFSSPDYSSIPTVRTTASSCPAGTGIPTLTPRKVGGSNFNNSDLTHNRGKAKIVDSFAGILDQLKQTKGCKIKNSQSDQTNTQPSTSSHISPRNTGRPQAHCSACGNMDHLRKDYQQDTFCIRCKSWSHTTKMCCAPTKQEKDNNICIYCGSKSNTSGKCTSRPNDNRQEPRSTPGDLQNHRFRNTGNPNHFFDQNRGGPQ